MIQYNEEIADNLDGMKPIDWDAAQAAFAIKNFKPDKLKIVPRNEQLRGLVDVAGGPEAFEKRMANDEKLREGTNAQRMLRLIARQYVQLQNKNARLPKFSKWVTSLFKDDKEMHNELAKYGQAVPKAPFVISCNPVDILRAADTGHFYTCLVHDGMFKDVLPGVVTKCPGIAVAYVNGADGKMQGRVWIHSGVDEDGKPCIILANHHYGNGVRHDELAAYIAAKGYDVYKDNGYWGGDQATPGQRKFVGCFEQELHWDTYTWNPAPKTHLLAKAK